MSARHCPAFLLLALPALAVTPCPQLAQVALPYTKIEIAESHAAGAFQPPGSNSPIKTLPALCRVAGSIKPTPSSDIKFEVWLPAEANWNGRFQGIGNGGFAGSISYGGLIGAAAAGYATASTDTGHQGDGISARWALNQPEKITDFAHRAIHEMTVKAKAIITAHYGRKPSKSYFASCSNGGRQALMEAQRYPGDYDGILAGAPALQWTSLMSAAVYFTRDAIAAQFNAENLPALEAHVLKACDALDGITDGVIEYPPACRPDFKTIMCAGPHTAQCISRPQLDAIDQIYRGARDGSGRLINPGYPPGNEAHPAGWPAWITGPQPGQALLYRFGQDFYRYMVYSDPEWDTRKFDLTRDHAVASKKFGALLDANNPNLKPFFARGGKLLLYHGWCDAAIPAGSTIDYYEQVLKNTGPARAKRSLRLFLAPGVQHCGGGNGPDRFGQGGPSNGDPAKDMNAALQRWVEQGTAPEVIIATKATPARTRPLCAYPLVAKYKGTGSTDDAANFTCAPYSPR